MKGPEPGVFEKQLRGECGRREMKKGRAVGVEVREQGGRSYIGHNDDDFVCTSSKVGSHESSDPRKNMISRVIRIMMAAGLRTDLSGGRQRLKLRD